MKKCEDWLKSNHPDMHTKLYSQGTVVQSADSSRQAALGRDEANNNVHTEAIEQNLSTLSLDAQKRAEKDAKKKEAKAAASEAKEKEQRENSKVLIKRIERNKRKYVTAVQGLEAFGLDIKKVAKDFGKKFATGSSVTKVPGGGEEITVQGDLSDDIYDFLTETYKDIPEDNVECIEDKKKKKEAAG